MRTALSWLLLGSEGLCLPDKLVLLAVKTIYLCTRVLLRISLGKERRDRWYIKHHLDFGSFWYAAFRHLGTPRTSDGLLLFRSPKFGYEFYCRRNKDDFKIMTTHEAEVLEHFKPKDGEVVIDIGAHIGLYTLIASTCVGSNGKVLAIEPELCNFEILRRNIMINKLRNVHALNYAVFSKEQMVKLQLRGSDSGFTKFNTIMPLPDLTEGKNKSVTVKADTLDNILECISINQVNWIKIDVEGAEFEVLEGALGVLSKNKNIQLLIEVHPISDYVHKLEEFIRLYNCTILFKKIYKENGSMHIVLRTNASTS